MNNNKVVVALSGGVDSAVSALLLKKAGYEVTGVYLKNFDIKSWLSEKKSNEKIDSACTSIIDQKNAERVANFLGIPFYVLNFESEYKKYVFSRFIADYKKGITPNPDVWCNTYIKFGKLLDFCQKIDPGCKLATGHYARLRRANLKFKIQNSKPQLKIQNLLLRGKDVSKDQSYFLWQLNQEQLSKIIFPIGEKLKSQVRKIAIDNKLPNALKKDSQGICFVGKLPVKEFLKSMIKPKAGDVVLPSGIKIGEHEGAHFYTIGERFGIQKIKNHPSRLGRSEAEKSKIFGPNSRPLYIIDKNIKNNQLIVDYDEGQEPLWRKEFTVRDVHWIGESPKKDEFIDIEIRYHQSPKSKGKISKIQDAITKQYSNNNNQNPNRSKIEKLVLSQSKDCKFQILLREPVRAVTPGQHVVFYRGNEVLGGAIISK